MLTHPMSTLRVLFILMHMSAGHVPLSLGKFHSPQIFAPIGLRAQGGLTLSFAPNF